MRGKNNNNNNKTTQHKTNVAEHSQINLQI